MSTMEPINHYTDYRAYLRDFFQDRKKSNPSYSYRLFNKTAGITSPSLFKEIVDHKRGLTPATIPLFIKGMHLNDRDARFFRAMVRFNQAKTDHEKLEQLEFMRGLKPSVKQTLVPMSQYEYYAKWYHGTVRELACTLDWSGDYTRLAHAVSPRISKREARESVELLLKLGFIRKTKTGGYIQADPAISTGSEVVSLAVRKLNKDMAGLGQEAVEAYSPVRRHITSMIMGISEKSYGLIKREILEFKQRLCNIVDDDKDTDRVYNINIQLFPVSEVYTDERVKQPEKEEGPPKT